MLDITKKNDPENFYRETPMLFHPWTEENEIIGMNDSYKDRFMEVLASSEIQKIMNNYNHNSYV